MSLFVPKWSRLLEVILGRFKQGTFGFIWLDLFQFLPTQTIIPPYRTFTHLSPTFFFNSCQPRFLQQIFGLWWKPNLTLGRISLPRHTAVGSTWFRTLISNVGWETRTNLEKFPVKETLTCTVSMLVDFIPIISIKPWEYFKTPEWEQPRISMLSEWWRDRTCEEFLHFCFDINRSSFTPTSSKHVSFVVKSWRRCRAQRQPVRDWMTTTGVLRCQCCLNMLLLMFCGGWVASCLLCEAAGQWGQAGFRLKERCRWIISRLRVISYEPN